MCSLILLACMRSASTSSNKASTRGLMGSSSSLSNLQHTFQNFQHGLACLLPAAGRDSHPSARLFRSW
ncbi:unnamed protein product [Mycena citricolor]|uniref:Secreted protein n=1 Tax=Mycena citricolor TaxID=2018698 RepID=A0AAD2GV45_9AGAR|nr:unnamed protein product [Mycena citricolor]